MGVKIVYTVLGFIGLSATSLLTGLMTAQHSISFFSLYGIKVARIWVYMSSVQTQSSGNDFCRALKQIVSQENLNWCSGLDGLTDIQDVQQRFCSPAFAHVWPGFCNGLQSAYSVGMAVNLVVFVNLCLQVSAAYLLWDYIHGGKANPKYRKSSLITLGIGLVFLVMVLLYYGMAVLTELSSVSTGSGVSSIFSAVLAASKGIGMSHGYVFLWMGGVFQFCAIALFVEAKLHKQEEHYKENKALKEYQQDSATYGTGGGRELMSSATDHQQQIPAGQPGFGMQPQGFGMQPQGFGMQPQGLGMQPQGFAAVQQQGFRRQGDFGV